MRLEVAFRGRISLVALGLLLLTSTSSASPQALQLDGTTGTYAEIPVTSGDALAGHPPFTIECWFKDEGSMVFSGQIAPLCGRFLSARSWLLGGLGAPASNTGGRFGTNSCGTSSGCWTETEWLTDESSLAGRWTHYAGVRTATEIRLYVDGVLRAARPAPSVFTASSDPMLIGAQLFGTSSTTVGKIDEVRFWNVARTAGEISSGLGREIETAPGLVARWPFNGDFLDSIGGFHATPRGNASIANGDTPLSPFTGSDEDLRLLTGVNSAPVFGTSKPVLAGDHLTVLLESPLGAYDGVVPIIGAQLFVTGTAPTQITGLEEIWLDPFPTAPFPIVALYDGWAAPFPPGVLPPGGLALGFTMPPFPSGHSIMIQGFALAPSANTGQLFTTTDAQEVQIQ